MSFQNHITFFCGAFKYSDSSEVTIIVLITNYKEQIMHKPGVVSTLMSSPGVR